MAVVYSFFQVTLTTKVPSDKKKASKLWPLFDDKLQLKNTHKMNQE
jgi:hypothetical protein